MDIDRISPVMKVPRRAVFTEKVCPVEFVAAPYARIELSCAGVLADGLQRTQVVSSMEVVDPALRRRFAVIP
jgi:hypothetical protein